MVPMGMQTKGADAVAELTASAKTQRCLPTKARVSLSSSEWGPRLCAMVNGERPGVVNTALWDCGSQCTMRSKTAGKREGEVNSNVKKLVEQRRRQSYAVFVGIMVVVKIADRKRRD